MSAQQPETVTLVGERNSWHATRIRSFLDRNIYPYLWVDADAAEGETLLESLPEKDRVKQPVLLAERKRCANSMALPRRARSTPFLEDQARRRALHVVGGVGLTLGVYLHRRARLRVTGGLDL